MVSNISVLVDQTANDAARKRAASGAKNRQMTRQAGRGRRARDRRYRPAESPISPWWPAYVINITTYQFGVVKRRLRLGRIGSPDGTKSGFPGDFEGRNEGDCSAIRPRPVADGVPSPLAGEGARRADEGSLSAHSVARRFAPIAQPKGCGTPHPALRATFSRKGRRQPLPPPATDYTLSLPMSYLSAEPVGRQPMTCLACEVSRQRRLFSEMASKMSKRTLSGASRHLSTICTASACDR